MTAAQVQPWGCDWIRLTRKFRDSANYWCERPVIIAATKIIAIEVGANGQSVIRTRSDSYSVKESVDVIWSLLGGADE